MIYVKWEIIKWILRLILLLFALLPIYGGVVIALTPFARVGEELLVPRYMYFQNFLEIWRAINFDRMLTNSLVYAGLTALLNLIVSVPAAYAFSRFRFRGREPMLFGLLLTQMMAEVIILPSLYILLRSLGLLNTYIGVILTLTGVTTALSVWLLVGFFDSIPREIEEAAFIDGATQVQVLLRIVFPLASPGIVAAAIFAFLNSYNNFIIPLVFLSREVLYPVTLGLYGIMGEMIKRWELLMSGSILSFIPPLLIYLFLQRYVTKGLTAGGLKM
jgi:ABC-type glycerol-3-phosphate transport system permease component